jgi:nicotinamide phosphoribosyltransferase
MEMNPFLMTDWYKVGHPFQYPKGTITVYSNLTARKSRMPGVDKVVVFGFQHFFQEYLIDYFNRNFFYRPKGAVMFEYKHRVRTALGFDLPSYQHIEDIHDLGYLPVEIKILPEGSVVDVRVPMLTIKNTHPKFFWVTNFLETLLSCSTWQAITSATIAFEYKKLLLHYAEETGMPTEFVQWQGHDFSMRGMSSFESCAISGAGHLLSFNGTDTIPSIELLEQYYGADADKEIIGGSIPATEHAVMCAGTGVEGEFNTFKRLITETYPNGPVAIVSDTFNLWDVLTDFMPRLKDEIMARDGKLVIRPDSGDPVDIICGSIQPDEFIKIEEGEDYGEYTLKEIIEEYCDTPSFSSYDEENEIQYYTYKGKQYKVEFKAGECLEARWDGSIFSSSIVSVTELTPSPESKGVIELLWDVFGGTINEKGYKVLDSHVGAIYGDSITLQRAKEICERLKAKGFASQVVFGIGSYTYQYNTRDTFGMAIKATYIEIEEKEPVSDGHHGHYGYENIKIRGIEIFKDPVTDDGTKKSAKGLLKVEEYVKMNLGGNFEHERFVLVDQVDWSGEGKGALKTAFKDGKLTRFETLNQIRERLNSFLKVGESKSLSYI